MNTQTAIRNFDSALSVMVEYTRIVKRANQLTWDNSAFATFDQLINAKGGYRPSLSRATPDARELGRIYDAAQIARGDDRRAFMYGTPKRKGSIIDRRNWDAGESWYTQGNRRTFWDRHTRQWIAFTVCGKGYQVGDADFYPNSRDLLMAEHAHA